MRNSKIKSKLEEPMDPKKRAYRIAIAIIIILILAFNYFRMNKMLDSNNAYINDFEKKVEDKVSREPAVAGLFYSASREQLDKDVEHFLKDADETSNVMPKMLIVPHAGYQYSGAIAAKAYSLLKPYAKDIKKVVIVGPSHYENLVGAALPDYDSFKTPLGVLDIDRGISKQLLEHNSFIKVSNKAHEKEHSIEVQLPFLQKVLDSFTIIPIAYGEILPEKLALALEPLLKRNDTIIIISADLSHYYNYDHAKAMDEHTSNMITANDADIGHDFSCGATGINMALVLSKNENLYPETIDLKNSGDISGDKTKVVGYGAWSFTEDETRKVGIEKELDSLKNFAEVHKNELIEIVQISLEDATLKDELYKPSRKDYSNDMFNLGASFVTLTEDGELRGCMGTVVPYQAVALDVATSAYNAAMSDNRFKKLDSDELKKLNFSISLLTNLERVRFLDEEDLLAKIEAEKDGLVMIDGSRKGLFLPSVWKEIPDKKDFLQALKIKTGLSPLYWSNKVHIYRFFTVEIKKNEN